MGTVRNYAALPHEYLEEMSVLSDAEFGRLVRSLLQYSMDGTPIALNGNERFYAVRAMNCEDRFQKSFQESDDKLRRAGQAGASARWNKDTTACDRMPPDAIAYDGMRSDAIDAFQYQTETNTETNTKPKSPSGSKAHARGEYGWVKLTDDQYEKLEEDLGQEELQRCIRYIDESAQSTSNKNKWKDWNLVIRKCSRDGWGKEQKSKQITTAAEYKPPAKPQSTADIYALVDRI